MARKNIWLTGASSGIGLDLAKALAADGHYVIASGRNESALAELKRLYPNHVACLAFDLTDEEHWQGLSERLSSIVDQLDMVLIGAGVCEYVDSPQEPLALYRRVFEVNFFAAIKVFNIALPFLQRSDRPARVAGIGSLSAQAAFTRAQAYGASKSALEYWLECQRIDLKQKNIAVTVISPGFVDTPLTKNNDFAMPGMVSAEQAAHIIRDGLAKEKMYIRFPKRLYWPLRLARWLPGLWFGWLADRMQRSQNI